MSELVNRMYETRSDATTEDQSGVVLWHPDIHRQLLHEQSVFFTVAFEPSYRRDVALQVLDRGCGELGVRSYTVWELQRKPDVLVKLWLPAGKNTDDLLTSLRAAARQQPHLTMELTGSAFLVLRNLTHHLWPRHVEPADIDDVLELGGDYLTSGALTGTMPENLSSLVRRQLAAPASEAAVGIKFFIWLSISELLPNERARTTLEQELVRVVQTTQHVYATSVFAGQSSTKTADYLVSGRLKPDHYEALARELQPRLAALGEPFFATNTDTALSTLYGPIDRTEALLPPDQNRPSQRIPERDKIDLEYLLASDESDSLEFKGSAFNVIPTGDGELADVEITNRAKKVRDAITKSCAGFLNSGGGVLIIGVLETERVRLEVARRYNANAKQAGGYIVVGMDRYIEGKGELSWDEFERRLRSHLSDSITPTPDPWITIRKVEWSGLDVAAVIVSDANSWFWTKTSTDSDVFYVRYGNATRPLKGAAQIHHMRSRPDREVQ